MEWLVSDGVMSDSYGETVSVFIHPIYFGSHHMNSLDSQNCFTQDVYSFELTLHETNTTEQMYQIQHDELRPCIDGGV